MAEQMYVVISPFHNQFTRGDVVSADALAWPAPDSEAKADIAAHKAAVKENLDAMVADGAIREATEWESQLKVVPPEHMSDKPHQVAPKELVEARLVEVPSKPAPAKQKPTSAKPATKVATTPATSAAKKGAKFIETSTTPGTLAAQPAPTNTQASAESASPTPSAGSAD
jgi:hypothetical protein